MAEFGEQVWAKPLRRTHEKDNVKATLESRWIEATWVGVHDRTGEHVVLSRNSGLAVKVRTIRLRPEAERWNYEVIEAIRAKHAKELQPHVDRVAELRVRLREAGVSHDLHKQIIADNSMVLEHLQVRAPGCERVIVSKHA